MSTINWPTPDPFIEVLHIQEEQSSFKIIIQSTHPSCPCPHCGVPSSRPHRRYTRLIQDIPIGGKSVTLLLLTRKWFCDQAACDRKIFSERLRKIAFSTSCLDAEKVAKTIHLPVSHDVLTFHYSKNRCTTRVFSLL